MFQKGFSAAGQHFNCSLRLILVFAMVLTLVCPAFASNTYTIQADSDTYTVETSAFSSADMSDREAVTDLLNEAGVDVSSTDQIVPVTNEEDGTEQVTVTRAQYATLTVEGTLSTVLLQEGDTVQSMIEHLNIKLGKNDIVSLNGEDISSDLTKAVGGSDSVVINRVEITYFDKTKTSAYDTVYVADPYSYVGAEYVKQEGQKGKTVKTYEKKIIDGGKPIITLVKTTKKGSKDKIIAYGTAVSSPTGYLSTSKPYITNRDERNKTITLSDGSTYSYWKQDTYTATAYTSGKNGRTSTGRKAQVGVIAVDPSVIPYGTLMYVQSGGNNYGICVAGDCGGGIKGKRVDLYFETRSKCMTFGRRDCTIYFLG